MDSGEGLEKPLEKGTRFRSGVVVPYVTVAAALAILRVSLLVWLEYRSLSDSVSPTEYSLVWVLYPEELLANYTRLSTINFTSLTAYLLFWGACQALGSFIIATPILLVGWLRQSRR